MIFAKCTCSAGGICLYCAQLTIVALVTVLGGLIAWKPKRTIDIQIAIYRPLNWKLEPVSWEKEIRNTRLMGLTVFTLGIIAFIYIVLVP